MSRARALLSSVLLSSGLALAGLVSAPALAQAKPAAGPPSKAVTPEILDAIAEEMDRALARLRIDGAPAPYHISYKVTEVEVHDAVASLGHTTARKERHFVNIEARVRVGGYDFDNGNFVVPRAEGLDGVSATNLPLEATPRIARRAAWLVTDQAFKEALVQLRAKLDAHKNRGPAAVTTPSWGQDKPLVNEEPVLVPALESIDVIEARARELSALFRGHEHVRASRVAITSYLERRWYLNSEGTSATDTRRAAGIALAATAQADDGQELVQYFTRYGHTLRDLPGDADLKLEARRLTDTLAKLRTAPVLAPYSGPVLFEGEGAVGIIRDTLAPHLGGTPLPEGLSPEQAKRFGGGLTNKLGLRPLATMLSIVDDPTASASAGKAIIGGYRIDDEGVAAQRVELVKDGTLAALLTSRTPSGKGATSNGHARRVATGGMFHGSATNLFVSGKGGLARAGLVARLIAAAKAERLPYGLIIKQLDDAAITAEPEFSRRELFQLVTSADQSLPPPATLAYRVYPDGREELVRGAQLAEVPMTAWKDVLAVGKTLTVANFLESTENYLEHRVEGPDDGMVPSAGIESSVTTPDLLFRSLDIVAPTAGQYARPVIPPPSLP
ncbi:MAG: hypothetical protein KBG28_26895 [Kofleriaceae bacterium]|nr:hypothetical protein [Kofleriaceae bacterium]MBP6837059.1 hypothetical protein [Kofleriaceae bacterium]MBP9207622.1 hypothetical protein [Kofleriaceae bacterium]